MSPDNNNGWIRLARGVLDHPTVGAGKHYCELEAWLWLLFEAAFKPRRVRLTSGRAVEVLELKRGQVAHSLRYMATAWGWSDKKVRTFLYRLKMDRQIDAQTGHLQTVITLCNYERYQTPEEPPHTQTNAQSDAQRTRNRRKEEQLNNKDAAPNGAPIVETDEADLFRRGKIILGQSAGGLIASLLKAKKGSVPLARAAIEQASTKENPREYIGAVIRGPVVDRHGPNDPLAGIL